MSEERALTVGVLLKPTDRRRVDRVAATQTLGRKARACPLTARFIAGRLFHWASGLLQPHCRRRRALSIRKERAGSEGGSLPAFNSLRGGRGDGAQAVYGG
jgi:hypothetical protein